MARKILIIEDHPDTRAVMRKLLEMHGCEVYEASDDYTGIEKAIAVTPDMVFMDLAMPVLDGVHSIEAMRQHEKLADMPIVAVTAYSDFYTERALAAGCNEVLQKPLDFAELLPLVDRYTI